MHFRDAGLPQTFQILDTQDQLAVIKRLLKSLNVDDEKYPPRDLQYFINGNKEAGSAPAPGRGLRRVFAPPERAVRGVRRVCATARAWSISPSCCCAASSCCRATRSCSEHYQQRFAHILVDEFQDTNRLQYRWLKLLAGADNAIFAVGDDDQSIYAFRGASASNMFEFERDFAKGRGDQAGAELPQPRQHPGRGQRADPAQPASGWARSCGPPRARASRCGCSRRRPTSRKPPSSSKRCEACAAKACACPTSRCCIGRTRSRACWSTRCSTPALPYRVYGGLRFFERQEIKHALAYLRLVASPDDDGALLRVVNLPARGVGSRSLEQLQEAARMRGRQPVAGGLLDAAGGQGRLRRRGVRPADRADARTIAWACRCREMVEARDRRQRPEGATTSRSATAPDRIENLRRTGQRGRGLRSRRRRCRRRDAGGARGRRRTTQSGDPRLRAAQRLPRPRLAGSRRAPGGRRCGSACS